MNPKKILMFGWEYEPYFTGGLGVVTKSIIKSLHSLGHDIVFVLPRIPIDIQEKFGRIVNAGNFKLTTSDSEIFTSIEIPSVLNPYYKNVFGLLDDVFIEESFSNEIYGRNLQKEIEIYSKKAEFISKKYPHQIIHTHDWMTTKAGEVAKSVSNAPVVMHVHATEFDRTGGNPSQFVYDIEKEGMENSDLIIAVSELTKKTIIKNYGIPDQKIHVVHNAIEMYPEIKKTGKKINKTDKIVLFLGRMTVQKGADYLLEAAQKVLMNKKRVKFVFVGNGSGLKDTINKSIDLGIEKNVMFAGFMNHDEIDIAYQNADVYVMPSISEPFGITALEAIKNGVPVIISKQSGVSEIIKNALKVDFWDTDELANMILGIIRYEPLSKYLSHNAKKEIEKHTWEKQAKIISKIYDEIS